MLNLFFIAAADWDFLFAGLFQTLVVAAVAFVIAVLVVSHLRYEKLSLDAEDSGESGMDAYEAFKIRISNYLGGLHRQPPPFSVVLFTLADLEQLRAEFSFSEVERMMEYLTTELREALRSGDELKLYEEVNIGLVARIERDDLEGFLERLNHTAVVESYRTQDGKLMKLGLNIGVATFPENGLDAEMLLEAANVARDFAVADPDLTWHISEEMVEFKSVESADEEEEEDDDDEDLSSEQANESEPDVVSPSSDKNVEDEERNGEDESTSPKGGGFSFLKRLAAVPDDDDDDDDDDEEEEEEKPKREKRRRLKAKQVVDDDEDEDEDEGEEELALQDRYLDELTGVLGVSYSGSATQKFIAKYRKDEHPVSVLYIDVDGLDQYNNHYGKKAGDQILRSLGEVLEDQLREDDIIGRVGGEEFVVCMATRPQQALIAAKRLCSDIKKTNVIFSGNKLKFTVCIGVAGFPDHGGVARSLFERAIIAMRAAKYRGRSMCEMYHPDMRSSTIVEESMSGPTDAF